MLAAPNDYPPSLREKLAAARPLRPASATRCWGRPRRPAPWRGYRDLRPNTPRPARSAPPLPVCRGRGCRGSPKSSRRTTYSGTAARGRHWDDHWPGDCHAPASPDRHKRCADKSAWRCRRTRTPVRRCHRVGRYRRRRLGRRGLSCTQGTVRLVRQAVKGFRRVRSFALGLDGRRCR